MSTPSFQTTSVSLLPAALVWAGLAAVLFYTTAAMIAFASTRD